MTIGQRVIPKPNGLLSGLTAVEPIDCIVWYRAYHQFSCLFRSRGDAGFRGNKRAASHAGEDLESVRDEDIFPPCQATESGDEQSYSHEITE